MDNLLETIVNPFTPVKGCVETIHIYENRVEINRVKMPSITFLYRDYAKVDLQIASWYCGYAMIVFLEKDYYKVKIIHGTPSLPEPNRIYFFDNAFSDGKVNEFATDVASKINAAIQDFKQIAIANATMSEADKISLLKQYKELLDSGIITKEEFDSKKANLLNNSSVISPIVTNVSQQSDIVCCPKCGSTEYHSGKRGWNLWSGLLGSSKVIMTCLKCGHKWSPKDYEK